MLRTTNGRSRVAPSAEFLRMAQTIELLRRSGLSERAIDALIREKVLTDLAEEKARRREPSLN